MLRLSWYPRAVPLLLAFGLTVPAQAAAQGIEEPRVPLRTAISEVNTLRSEYADGYNRKDAASLGAVYAADAILISPEGMIRGGDSIRAMIAENAPTYGHIVLVSDTLRIHGNTAVDMGRMTVHPAGGGEEVSHYLVVLRRGMDRWRIVSLAVVPQTEGEQATEASGE